MTIKLSSLIWLTSVGFAFLLSFELLAQQAEQELKQNAEQTSSRQAYIDEKTGELTSTPAVDEQASTSPEQTNRTVEKEIIYVTHPDGTVEGRLDGHFQSELRVTLGCDGSLRKSHSKQNSKELDTCEERE